MSDGSDGHAVPRVTVLVRPGCHLCAEAIATVSAVCAEVGASWSEVNIDDPAVAAAALRDRYHDYVPVVLVDGGEHDYWRVSADRLRRELSTPRSPSGA